MTETRNRIVEIAARNWWIVLLATVTGGVVAYLIAGSGPVSYEASAPIHIDTATLSTQPRVPKPDAVIAIVQDPAFAEELALPDGATLRAYATGNPQNELFVAVTASNEADAEKATIKAAEKTIEAIHAEMEPTLADQRALIASNESALKALGEPAEGDDLAQFLRWDIEKDNLNERSLLDFLESAYSYDGDVTVAEAASTRSAAVAGIGGALAGFFLGLVLVAVRERAAFRAA